MEDKSLWMTTFIWCKSASK